MPTPPSVTVTAEPTTCLTINQEWVSIVLGLLWRGERDGFWTEDELDGIDGIREIASNLVNGNCPMPDYKLLVPKTAFGAGAGAAIMDNIDQSYRSLRLTWRARVGSAVAGRDLRLHVNEDTTIANYRSFNRRIFGGSGNDESTHLGTIGALNLRVGASGASAPANEYAFGQLTIHNYAVATEWRHFDWLISCRLATDASGMQIVHGFGKWLNSAAAITKLTLGSSIAESFNGDSWYTLAAFDPL